jgi:hypothetical protein
MRWRQPPWFSLAIPADMRTAVAAGYAAGALGLSNWKNWAAGPKFTQNPLIF